MENLEEARPDTLVGTLVDGRFDILGLVGEGGIGIVYRARHVLMDRIVAFKMLRSEFVNDPIASGRFIQEGRAVCALSHPNIVSAYDFGFTSTGHAYMAMDFLEGEDLDTYIADRGALPLEQCFPMFLQICEALNHAHKVGIIHRDLKPSNIVLLPVGNGPRLVKLVDFGMAKFTAGASLKALKLTKPGDVFGSPYYMSPEQFQGPDLDARSDIYSLGCLMYEAVTGLPPHMGEDYLDVMRNHLAVLPQAKGILAEPDAVSVELKRIIFKTLEKAAVDRYQTVEELLVDLKNLIELKDGGTVKAEATGGSGTAHGASAKGKSGSATGANSGAPAKTSASSASKAPGKASDSNNLTAPGMPKGILIAAAVLLVGALAGVFLMVNPRTDNLPAVGVWLQLDQNAAKAFKDGDFAKAEELYKQAVAEAEKRGENENLELSKSLESLASTYQRMKKFGPAEEALKRSIEVCKRQADFEASQLSPLYLKLEELYKEQGRSDEAVAVHQQLMDIVNGGARGATSRPK